MSPEALTALDKSLAIFKELGWHEASREDDLMALPLGDNAQQKTAKAGLAKGEWGNFAEIAEDSWGWVSTIDVDPCLLGVYTIRLGVPARRAFEVYPVALAVESQAKLLAARGAEFLTQFTALRRAGSRYTPAITSALNQLPEAPLPTDTDYLQNWAIQSFAAFEVSTPKQNLDPIARREAEALARSAQVPLTEITPRLAEHLRAVLRGGVSTSGDWSGLIKHTVDAGYLEQSEAQELTLYAMEAAQRPIDRKTFAEVLTNDLAADEAFLLEHASVLASVLSFGEDALIHLFTPTLLSATDDELTAQVILIGLNAKSTKAKAAVLTAAMQAAQPGDETKTIIAETLAPLLNAKDKKLAALAAQLKDTWQLDAQALKEEPVPGARGLWQATPALAAVPRLAEGRSGAEELTALTSELLAANNESLTLAGERFLATANAVAREDPAAAREALRGVPRRWEAVLHPVRGWVRGETMIGADQPASAGKNAHVESVVRARAAAVFLRLGEVPILLSTPTWQDFRVDGADLAARLDRYVEADAAVSEADLQLMLSRLDRDSLDVTLRAKLAASPVRIVLQDGTVLRRNVGDVLGTVLSKPYEHPGFDSDGFAKELPSIAELSGSADLPDRRIGRNITITEFPNWAESELEWRQPGAAINRKAPNGVVPSSALLSFSEERSGDIEAAIAAWQHGTLVPGIADARQFVWGGSISSIASRVRNWQELAENGMLSLIWPLVADVVQISSEQSRIAPGVTEAIELLQLMLPEVQLAVDAGLAGSDTMALPGVRAIASRTGSSKAVAAARALVSILPETAMVASPGGNAGSPGVLATPAEMSDTEFAEAWQATGDPASIDDGAILKYEAVQTKRGSVMVVHLTLGDGTECQFESSWTYGLGMEGRASLGDQKWLEFDAESGRLVEISERYRREAPPVLSRSLMVLFFATQQQADPEMYYFGAAVENGLLGPTRMADTTSLMLAEADFNPYLMVRQLSRYPELLSAFYPVLTRSIAHASTLGTTPPRWLVRIIDIAIEFAPVLRAAAARGQMLESEAGWAGLVEIGDTTRSAAVKRKAKVLIEALG
ncbi:hypothetical protein QBL02_13590 [Leucobacter sp. UT-8R-CII-1-4]|uniref:DUF7824 domain-containing protein n=1 Tax=Leucobacter sp. UT-8R-CII-1-4 TaxID=3040075 RepID=UPI0024A8F8FE|nr:hypothetical protein [Leucobacter sp. UT-8R-CII-1-4]MDI6024572.1 hypothetical protein [Leucobacter sp. UT-8R-CII-1-4]